MKILLTGGTGYIGSHTAVVLSEAGHEVVLLDNFCNSKSSVLDYLCEILNKRLPFINCDVRDTSAVAKALIDYKIDAVIHFAGLKAVGDSVNSPIDYYSNNVQGSISLLEAMKIANIKTLVFSSSATVYGNPQYLPIDEGHPTRPENPYGRTKLYVENMLKDLADSNSSWKILCLRYFNPAGAHDSGLLGEDPNGVPNNLIPYIAMVSTAKLPFLQIYGDDYPTVDGSGVRDFLHVMDLAEGHLAGIIYADQNTGFNVINLGTGKGCSVFQMLDCYSSVLGEKIPYRIVSRRVGDIAECYADVNKSKAELQWSAKRTIVDICSSSWNYKNSISQE